MYICNVTVRYYWSKCKDNAQKYIDKRNKNSTGVSSMCFTKDFSIERNEYDIMIYCLRIFYSIEIFAG